MNQSGDAMGNVIVSDQFGGGPVMVWEGITTTNNNTYAGAVGPGFHLEHDSAWPHLARVCRHFLHKAQVQLTHVLQT